MVRRGTVTSAARWVACSVFVAASLSVTVASVDVDEQGSVASPGFVVRVHVNATRRFAGEAVLVLSIPAEMVPTWQIARQARVSKWRSASGGGSDSEGPQRLHRIDGGGSSRRQPSREQTSGEQHDDRERKCAD